MRLSNTSFDKSDGRDDDCTISIVRFGARIRFETRFRLTFALSDGVFEVGECEVDFGTVGEVRERLGLQRYHLHLDGALPALEHNRVSRAVFVDDHLGSRTKSHPPNQNLCSRDVNKNSNR